MRQSCVRALLLAAALAWGATMPPGSMAQAPQPSPPTSAPDQTAIESVTLARGVKTQNLFGSGLVTPVDPTTTFISTDLPYAVVRVKNLTPDTTVSLQLSDPTGPAYKLAAVVPHNIRGKPKQFDFAAPLYILGTDFESHVGTWHLQVTLNGQPQTTTAFVWTQASRLELPNIKALVDANPTEPDLHWRYGAALALFDHTAEAIQELQSAIRLDHRYALYHITLGRIYERQGRPADAIREFKTALELHGSTWDAIFSSWAQAHLTKLQGH